VIDPTIEAPLSVEIEAEVYFQPTDVQSGDSPTALTSQRRPPERRPMPPSLRRLGQRLRALGPGFVNAFLRDNKVLPPVLALLALVVFAWVVAGTFVGGPEEEQVSSQSNLAQSQNTPVEDPVAPEAENRDVDSYAAYRNKDPFRQLLAPPEGTSGQSTDETTQPPGEDTSGTTGSDGSGSTTGNSPASYRWRRWSGPGHGQRRPERPQGGPRSPRPPEPRYGRRRGPRRRRRRRRRRKAGWSGRRGGQQRRRERPLLRRCRRQRPRRQRGSGHRRQARPRWRLARQRR
jgi:hypothetical protein